MDSCIFISWLIGEQRSDPEETKGVAEIMSHIDDGKVRMITSVLTKAEVLRCTLLPDAQKQFDEVLRRSNVSVQNTDHVTWTLTHDLRDFYKKLQQQGGPKTLSTPDAIHLATAIQFEVDDFYTFDGKDKNGKPRALLPLNGNVAGHDLKITRPLGDLDLFTAANVDEPKEDEQ